MTDPVARLRAGEALAARADPVRLAATSRRNLVLTVACASLAVVALGGSGYALLDRVRPTLFASLGAFGVVVLALVALLVHQRRHLRRCVAPDGTVLAFTREALVLGPLLCPWTEVVGVGVADMRPEIARRRRRVLLRGITSLAQRSGNGSVALTVVVRDGDAARGALAPADRRLVRTWPHRSGVRRGEVRVLLDTLLDAGQVEAVLRDLGPVLAHVGVPLEPVTDRQGYLAQLGRLTDDQRA